MKKSAFLLLGSLTVAGQVQAQGPASGSHSAVATSHDTSASAETESSSAPLDEEEQARREQAAERFQRGLSFYEQGEHKLALVEFERAYELVPDYRVLYNLALVSIQVGGFARARTALEIYLKEAGDQIDAARRSEIEHDLSQLRDRTATVRLTASPTDAEVYVNDVNVGVTPLTDPLLFDVGDHRITLRKRGFESTTRALTLAGGENRELTLNLVQEPPEIRPTENAQNKASQGVRPIVWISWATTTAFGAAAIVTGIVGANEASKLNDLKASPNPNADELNQTAANAQGWLLAADIALGATAVALGTSLYVTLWGGEDEDGKAASSTARLRWAPTLAPTQDRGAAKLIPLGLEVQGHF